MRNTRSHFRTGKGAASKAWTTAGSLKGVIWRFYYIVLGEESQRCGSSFSFGAAESTLRNIRHDRNRMARHTRRMDILLLIGIALTFFAAGATKGISGMGLPTVSMGLLGLFMPPASAAALLVLPSLLTNVLQCLGRHFAGIAAILWPMWIGILAGALLTPLPSLASGTATVRLGLGSLLLAYAAYGLLRPTVTLQLSHGRLLLVALPVGYVTGVLTAATGIFIVPMVMFLQMLPFEKERMVQALGLSFTVCTVALGASLGWSTSWQALSSVEGATALACALAGMYFGAKMRDRISANAFRTMLFAVFGVLGAALIAKELL